MGRVMVAALILLTLYGIGLLVTRAINEAAAEESAMNGEPLK